MIDLAWLVYRIESPNANSCFGFGLYDVRFRCLDLRRQQMKNNIVLRHNVVKLIRRYLEDRHGFIEVCSYSIYIFQFWPVPSFSCWSVVYVRLKLQYSLDLLQKAREIIWFRQEFRCQYFFHPNVFPNKELSFPEV